MRHPVSAFIRRSSAVALALAFGASAVAQARPVELLREIANDAQRTGDERCVALGELQDHAALDVKTVVAALRGPDESVGATAAAIVRHEWPTLPPALFTALDAEPAAAAVLLREFAQAPRPAARAWVKAWLDRKQIPNDLHCLLLAARGEPLAPREVEPLFATLIAGEVSDGFHAAVGLLPAAVADALPGRVHALLTEHKVELGHLLPILDRMSVDGWRRLMGLVVTLPAEVAEDLGTHLVQHEVEAYRERAAAALDGKIPLEAIWLLRAGPLLDRPERRQRLLALLGDGNAAPALQARAFDALIDAGCVEPVVIRWALADGGDRHARLRRVLEAAVAELPDAMLAEWLSADQELARVTASALARRPVLGPQVEAVVTTMLLGAGVIEGAFLEALAMAVLQHGSEAAVERIWPRLRVSGRFAEFVEAFARRRGPFAHERLLAELAAERPADLEPAEREVQLDAVRLCLTSLGDRRQLAELVAHARTRSSAFVRRCAHHARPLDVRFGLALLDDAAAIADDDLAAELIGWAAAAPGPEIEARLLALWQAKDPSERQEVALRGLIAGSSRARLVQELATALQQGPLVERHEQLAYEVVATMPVPLAEADATLLAELVLEAPLADPIGERARALRWPDGHFGFPLVGAVAQRLRGTDGPAAGAAFLRVAQRVIDDPRRAALSRQRLLVLWRSLEMEPEMQTSIGRATAALLLALPKTETQAEELGAGPAHWFLVDVAARAGQPAAAAAHARIAARALLRLPSERRTARLFLGERDPAAGSDPWAALAAAPFVFDAEAARAAGDKNAGAAALALAQEFAGRDAAMLRRIEDVTKELTR